MNPRAEAFLKDVRLEDSRVQYPEDKIFFCGGKISQDGQIRSLRHYLWNEKSRVFNKYSVLLAEKAAESFDSRVYDDLMEFERYIASISRIVLLISESPGSIAELGAFSQIPEIAQRLLVFIQSEFYSDSSFVKDGPIRFLENNNEQSVWEFGWSSNEHNLLDITSENFLIPSLAAAVRTFSRVQPRTEKFDGNRIGHRILLVGGVIHLLGCCKIREISEALGAINIILAEKNIRQAIFCLKLFGWIKSVKRDTTYYIFSAQFESFVFRGNFWSKKFDIIRERYLILGSYSRDDPRLTAMETTIV